jgi:hypothetical protein
MMIKQSPSVTISAPQENDDDDDDDDDLRLLLLLVNRFLLEL